MKASQNVVSIRNEPSQSVRSRRMRLILLSGGEHFPANPHELVSQRHYSDVAMSSCLKGLQPYAQTRSFSCQIGVQRLRPLDKEVPQLHVSAFTDGAESWFSSGGELSRHQTEPRRHVARALEHASVSNRGDGGRSDYRSDSRHRYCSLAEIRLRCMLSQKRGELLHFSVK